MKMLVTGPRGFVGARIISQMRAAGVEAIPAPSLRDFSEEEIRRLICETEPDVVVHTAAISDIGTCEQNPEASYRANVEIPLWIARRGVKSLLFSTDQVYSGCRGEGPYREEETAPANTYARHKLEMEQRVLEANPDSVLLRATWMYDMPMYGVANRGNFLVNMLRQPAQSFSGTQHRAVTYVQQVAELIRPAASLPGGIYNYGSENDLTMLQTAQWLKQELKLPVTLSDAGERHHLWMDCSKLKSFGICFDTTLEGLKRSIRDYSL